MDYSKIVAKIDFDIYRKALYKEFDINYYTNTSVFKMFAKQFDTELGLTLLKEDNFEIYFKILDEKKWALAKIKYGF
jgi:hypothetical protein